MNGTEPKRKATTSAPVDVPELAVTWWWCGCRHRGHVDVADDGERLFARVVHPKHFLAPLRLLRRFLHQRRLIATRINVSQQFRGDEIFGLPIELVERKCENNGVVNHKIIQNERGIERASN